MGLKNDQIEEMADIFLPYIDKWLKKFENVRISIVRTNSVIIDGES